MAKKARVWNGSSWQDLASSTADLSSYANLNTTPISGYRNAVINGGMDVWQRGTSTFSTNASFTADRWQMYFSGTSTALSVSPIAPTAGNAIPGYEPTYVLRSAVTGGSGTNALAVVQQKIEDVRSFAGQTVTVSFWAKSTTGTPFIGMDFYQDFGTGGSTYVYLAGQKITASTSWSRYKVTFTIPSIAGKTIGSGSHLTLRLWLSAGSLNNFATDSMGIQSNTFDIWGVQVERGSIATPFEQRPIGTELALCQRYYWRVSPTAFKYVAMGQTRGGSPYALGFTIGIPVTMRIEPTISVNNIGAEPPAGGLIGLNPATLTSYSTSTSVGFLIQRTTGNWAANEPCMLILIDNTSWLEARAEL